MFRIFKIAIRSGWENPPQWGFGIGNFTEGGGGGGLPEAGNLRRSDFDDSNFFQS